MAGQVPKVFHGARAIVYVGSKVAGTFSSFSYGVSDDVAPAFILGRFSPAELTYTAQEPISCSATGWRVSKNGPHVVALFPNLRDLLRHASIEITVVDRQTGEAIAKISGIRPASYSMSINSKSQTEVSHQFVGMLVDDESETNTELPDAPQLPTV